MEQTRSETKRLEIQPVTGRFWEDIKSEERKINVSLSLLLLLLFPDLFLLSLQMKDLIKELTGNIMCTGFLAPSAHARLS